MASAVVFAQTPSSAGSSASPANERPSELPRTWQLPPKPKPGRKPNNDVPADKKRASNRTAQRKFRERKKQRVEHMQEEMDRMRVQQRKEAIKHAERIMKAEQQAREERLLFEQALKAAQDSEARVRRALEAQSQPTPPPIGPAGTGSPVEDARQQLQAYQLPPRSSISRGRSTDLRINSPTPLSDRSSTGTLLTPGSVLPQPLHTQNSPLSPYSPTDAGVEQIQAHPYVEDVVRNFPAPNVPKRNHGQTPNAVVYDDMEIDFTTKHPTQSSGQSETITPLSGDRCGFCSDASFCLCKASDAPVPLEPPATASGPQYILPGTCNTCLNDPEQRRICLDIADRHRPVHWLGNRLGANRENGNTSSPSTDLGLANENAPSPIDAQPLKRETVTCADAISMVRSSDENFSQRPDYHQWLDHLRIVPPSPDRECSSCNDKNCSAQDIEIASILTQDMREARRFGDGARDRVSTAHVGNEHTSRLPAIREHQDALPERSIGSSITT